MVTAVKDKGSKVAQLYSISAASKRLKKSDATVKRYKALLSNVWENDLSKVIDEKSGSLTQQGLDELSVIAGYMANGDPDGYEAVTIEKHPNLLSHELSGESIKATETQDFQGKTEKLEVVSYEPSLIDLRRNYQISTIDAEKIRGPIRLVEGVESVLAACQELCHAANEFMDEDHSVQLHNRDKTIAAEDEIRGYRQNMQVKKYMHHERTLRMQAETQLSNERIQAEMDLLQQ